MVPVRLQQLQGQLEANITILEAKEAMKTISAEEDLELSRLRADLAKVVETITNLNTIIIEKDE